MSGDGAGNACGECGLTYASLHDFDAHIRQHDNDRNGFATVMAEAANYGVHYDNSDETAAPKAVRPKKRNRRNNSLTAKNNNKSSDESNAKASDELYGNENTVSETVAVSPTVLDALKSAEVANGTNSNTYAAMLAAAAAAAAGPTGPTGQAGQVGGDSAGALLLAENLRRLLSSAGFFHGPATATTAAKISNGDAALNLSAAGPADLDNGLLLLTAVPSTSQPGSTDGRPPADTSVSPTLAAAPSSKGRKRAATGGRATPQSADSTMINSTVRGGKVAKVALQCQFCNFSTYMSQHMKSHLEAHERHRGQMYQCDICLTEFSQKANMHRHRTRHSGIKPYECAFCDKEFYRKDQMQEHSMTHIKTGTNFDCPVQNCREQFEQHPALRQHVEERHMAAAAAAGGGSQKQVGCKRCSLLFASARRLILHYQTKHDDHLKYLIAKKAETKAALRLSASPGGEPSTDGSPESAGGGALDLSSAERLAPPTAGRGRKRRAAVSGSASPFESLAGYRVDDLLGRPAALLAATATAPPPPPALSFSASSSPGASLSGGALNLRVTAEDRSNRSSPGGAPLPIGAPADVGHAFMSLARTFPLQSQPTDLMPVHLPRSKSPDYRNLFGGDYGSTATSIHRPMTSDELLIRLASTQDGSSSFNITREDQRPQLLFSVWGDAEASGGTSSDASAGLDSASASAAAGRQAHSATHSPHSASSGSNHSAERTAAAATAAALLLSVAGAGADNAAGVGALECVHCGILFRDLTLYLVHKGLHSADDAWRCNMCGFSSADKYTFHAHVITADHKRPVFSG